VKALLFLLPLGLLLLVGCGPGGGQSPTGGAPTVTPGSSPTAGTSEPAAAIACMPDEVEGDVSVAVVDFGYEPSAAMASVGQTVVWTNQGQAPHTVTFDDGPDCGRLNSGSSTGAVFNEAGEYSYICTIHPSMRATITIEP
jgi:plastocyanin